MTIDSAFPGLLAHSLYWPNVDHRIVDLHAQVFYHLGVPLKQTMQSGLPHGKWMNDVMESAEPGKILLFVDIDAIPLNREALVLAMKAADEGGILGCAQVANHMDRAHFIYAGPMFLALKKKTWVELNRPSFCADADFDTGMRLSYLATQRGVPIQLMYPNIVCIPKWKLADEGVFGIGTFYEGKVFHLFESRRGALYTDLFSYVAGNVLNGRGIDYLTAIALANGWKVRVRERLAARQERVANYFHFLRKTYIG